MALRRPEVNMKPISPLVSLVLLCASAQAEVLDRGPDGFTLSNSVTVTAPPERAWQALLAEIDFWWPRDHTWWGEDSTLSLSPRAGGCFCEMAGDRQAEHLRVVYSERPRLLRLSGGLGPMQGMGLHGILEWRLAEAEDGGTRLTLWYRAGGYGPEDLAGFADVVDGVMGQQLGALAAHLARPARLAD